MEWEAPSYKNKGFIVNSTRCCKFVSLLVEDLNQWSPTFAAWQPGWGEEGNWAVEVKDGCAKENEGRAIGSFVLLPFRLGRGLDEKCPNPSILYLLLLYVFCSFYTT